MRVRADYLKILQQFLGKSVITCAWCFFFLQFAKKFLRATQERMESLKPSGWRWGLHQELSGWRLGGEEEEEVRGDLGSVFVFFSQQFNPRNGRRTYPTLLEGRKKKTWMAWYLNKKKIREKTWKIRSGEGKKSAGISAEGETPNKTRRGSEKDAAASLFSASFCF